MSGHTFQILHKCPFYITRCSHLSLNFHPCRNGCHTGNFYCSGDNSLCDGCHIGVQYLDYNKTYQWVCHYDHKRLWCRFQLPWVWYWCPVSGLLQNISVSIWWSSSNFDLNHYCWSYRTVTKSLLICKHINKCILCGGGGERESQEGNYLQLLLKVVLSDSVMCSVSITLVH